jgi:S-formylglutathione hydrolase
MRLVFVLLLLAQAASAQSVERVIVHGKALEGNLAGDSPDRSVAIYLPAHYATSQRRYPVIYFLHGFRDTDEGWMGLVQDWIELPSLIQRALAESNTREAIVVVPNAYTRFLGSMYSASAATGDWEAFIASDLVAFIDSRYRTLPQAASRGLAGHSMGGYGAFRIAMKHPDVFPNLYVLNPCCLAPLNPQTEKPHAEAEAVKDFASLARADSKSQLILARCAAWAANPNRPPLFLDPLSQNGRFQPDVVTRWAANTLPELANPHVADLKKLHAFGLDVGAQDPWARDGRQLDEFLVAHGVAHRFELYQGDHLDRVAQRIQSKMLPFFAANLQFR